MDKSCLDYRGGGISKVVGPLQIKDDLCMCMGGGGGGEWKVSAMDLRVGLY